MRFALVDRIDEVRPGESIQAIKNLSIAEEYLADHFPGFPVMPGVMMLESLVQTGAWLMRCSEQFSYSMVLLETARALRFNSFVTPGQTLSLSGSVSEARDDRYVIKGTGKVGDTVVVSAKLTLRQFNLRENDAGLEQSDRDRVESLQQEFRRLCRPGALVGETDSGSGKA